MRIFRLTPVAGTDYPCWPSLPGRERFYTKVEGPVSYEAWLEGIRRGRTFVTNGPMLDFTVNGKGIGEEVMLKKPGTVLLEGGVRFDPARDNVSRLEVVENGQLLKSFPRPGQSSEIRFRFEHAVKEACWLAVRASGGKVNEVAHPEFQEFALVQGKKPSLAHTGATYVTLENAPGLAGHPRAKALARGWMARLEDLEARLSNDETLKRFVGGDSVKLEHVERDRKALLGAIESAKKHFSDQARE